MLCSRQCCLYYYHSTSKSRRGSLTIVDSYVTEVLSPGPIVVHHQALSLSGPHTKYGNFGIVNHVLERYSPNITCSAYNLQRMDERSQDPEHTRRRARIDRQDGQCIRQASCRFNFEHTVVHRSMLVTSQSHDRSWAVCFVSIIWGGCSLYLEL